MDDYFGRRKDKPCDYYSGNLCSGFGGSTNCSRCGWDLMAHQEFDKLFQPEGELLEK